MDPEASTYIPTGRGGVTDQGFSLIQLGSPIPGFLVPGFIGTRDSPGYGHATPATPAGITKIHGILARLPGPLRIRLLRILIGSSGDR